MDENKIKEQLAKIIVNSTLWNIGKDGHNALSELVEAIFDFIKKTGVSDGK